MKSLNLIENYDSKNLFKKVNILTEEQIIAIAMGLEWTITHLPNSVLIGGTAVIHYISGTRDLTPDLDFMVKDINSLKSKFAHQNITYRELFIGKVLGITVDKFNVDYFDSEIGNKELNWLTLQNPIIGIIGGYQVKIIAPELLAIMKFELGREKDINDAFALLSSGKCNINKYVSYVNKLKNSLQDYESLIGYKLLIQ